ncbi:anti-sigma factor family protein [Corynebacterium anserum]|uniref:Anti-sigma factor n=1 Tax=Corynebacterium anserum TaxID=2684406 RepID=A0A7G7YP92_9CORY|nr:zf-HC2 domain-containing protein [Corynebacterium anserum]QNH96312.1 anti-sigma factor [Corynebacterium anserum]
MVHAYKPDHALSVEHLSPEAMAALVDGELSPRAEHRAKVHLVHCQRCRDEVREQRRAAERLRDDCGVHASGSLIERLTRIPECCEEYSRDRGFGVDGRRRPETLIDGVDLFFRRIQRKSKSS